jgi:hypothetical protein
MKWKPKPAPTWITTLTWIISVNTDSSCQQVVLSPVHELAPSPIFAPAPKAAKRTLKFFTAQISNDHTRKAYLNATRRFAVWCDARRIRQLADVQYPGRAFQPHRNAHVRSLPAEGHAEYCGADFDSTTEDTACITCLFGRAFTSSASLPTTPGTSRSIRVPIPPGLGRWLTDGVEISFTQSNPTLVVVLGRFT